VELTLSETQVVLATDGASSGFSLDVPALDIGVGAMTFVMGHNGSGKTVWMRALAGEIQGQSVAAIVCENGSAVQAKVGFLRQRADDNLALDLSVLENIVIRIDLSSWRERLTPLRSARAVAEKTLASYSTLTGKLDSAVRYLSVGQRQTLAFACAAMGRCRLLLLDEFLAAADHATAELLRCLSRQYASVTPAAVMVVSHDPRLALTDGDRILVLRGGKLIRDYKRTEGWPDENQLRSDIVLSSMTEGAPST
jgi:ABC-type multidrug transport system ATPase subunit